MTIKDFILECENYSHSREHYELMKEAYEIDLMNQYVSDQLYMKENAMFEGYYSEAAEEDKVEEVKNEADAKTESLLDKIGKKLKEIIDGFIAFLAKFIPALRKQQEEEVVEEKDIVDEEVPSVKTADNSKEGKAIEKQKGIPAEYVTKINRIGKAMPVALQHKDVEFESKVDSITLSKFNEDGKRAVNAAYSDHILIRKVQGDKDIISLQYMNKILTQTITDKIVQAFEEGLKEFRDKGVTINFNTIDKDLEKSKQWKAAINKNLKAVKSLPIQAQTYVKILNVSMYSITTYIEILTAFLDFKTKHRANIIKMIES